MEEGEDDIRPIEESAEVNRSDASGARSDWQPGNNSHRVGLAEVIVDAQ